MKRFWLLTDKGDPHVRALVDGLIDGQIHYSRQTWGAPLFTRNGQNLVLIAYNGPTPVGAWVSFRPTPGKATRSDGREAIECALFKLIRSHGLRKETGGKLRSSHLIREARELTHALWGTPRDGLITFINPDRTTTQRSEEHEPGWCYRMDGWVDDRPSSSGRLCLRAPVPDAVSDIREWRWSGRRGGKLREDLLLDGVSLYDGPTTF